MIRVILAALVFALATPAAARESLQQRVEIALREGSPGTRFGLVVTTEDGRELIAIAPDQRFIPASNTKIVTTAAAFATLPNIDRPDGDGGAAVRLDGRDVILEGHGDARLSSAPDCAGDCLATLAEAVAAKTRIVRNVVGDDSLYPDERWSPGMSWNNIPTRSGTATSALTLDDNELLMRVTPGAIGTSPIVDFPAYYTLDNRATTVATGRTDLGFDRAPNDNTVRLTGTIAVGAAPEMLKLGIDDPARHAAWVFKAMLEARGVRVTGAVAARHRPLSAADDPDKRKGAPPARPPQEPVLAHLVPPPLAQDLVHINKVSQNLHAELMLRRIGLRNGTGSIADGLAEVRAMLAQAGVRRVDYDLSDGSGMSTYNRITPRGMVTLLRWIAARPWGAAWRATLPEGGTTGLKRFAGMPLDRKLFAKTGTINATSTLSGYMIAGSGRTLTFSFLANDIPEDGSVGKTVDKVLELIAAEN